MTATRAYSPATIDARAYGVVANGTTDDLAALQRALTAASTGSGGHKPIVLPPGSIKISDQLVLGTNTTWIGAGSRPGNQGGTSIEYAGPDGQDWVVGGSSGNDWSNCHLENLRIVKSGSTVYTSGYALRIYNPTNLSSVSEILVSGAPSGQIFIDNAAGGGANPGPNFFRLSNFFAIGGVTPLRIEGGAQQMKSDFGGIDLDSTSTHGMYVGGGEGQAFTLNVSSVKVEGSYDVPGFYVSGISPVTFIGCTRYNNALNGTAAAFKYENASQPVLQVILIGCTVKGTTVAFSAPDRSVSIPGSQSAGRYIPFVFPVRYGSFVPYGSANAQAKAIIMQPSVQLMWTTSSGDPDNWDTNLFREGANLLKTDDKFLAGAGIGVGNSAAATTLGTVTKKVEVFDAAGASIGFVPVYNAIT